MAEMAKSNVEQSFLAVIDGNSKRLTGVERTEDYVDFLNKEISKYISHIMVYETNERDSETISAFFKICGNLERISDHAMNICEYSKRMEEEHRSFSVMAVVEIENMKSTCLEAMSYFKTMEPFSPETLDKLAVLEQKIDNMTDNYRENQINRMKVKECAHEASILYSEMLTDFERIGDHALNIAEALATIS